MVIQRWQSVFLLIVTAMMACFTFFSLGQVQMPDFSLDFTTMGFSIEGEATGGGPIGYYMHTWPFFSISLLCTLLPFIAIFMYRNMRLQKTICIIEVLLIVTLVLMGLAYGYKNEALESYQVSWSSLIITLPIAVVADLLAYNRISADQKLLRSTERLR